MADARGWLVGFVSVSANLTGGLLPVLLRLQVLGRRSPFFFGMLGMGGYSWSLIYNCDESEVGSESESYAAERVLLRGGGVP
jgi:hypothetical protein